MNLLTSFPDAGSVTRTWASPLYFDSTEERERREKLSKNPSGSLWPLSSPREDFFSTSAPARRVRWGLVWLGSTPPSQVGCDSQRNWAGEPIRHRGCWHKLSEKELDQSTAQRGGASPTRNRAQWGKGLRFSQKKNKPLLSLSLRETFAWPWQIPSLGKEASFSPLAFPPACHYFGGPCLFFSRVWIRSLPSQRDAWQAYTVPNLFSPGSRWFC